MNEPDYTECEVDIIGGRRFPRVTFERYVEEGILTDSDGFGYPMYKGMVSTEKSTIVKPSKVKELHSTVDHIIWFNK